MKKFILFLLPCFMTVAGYAQTLTLGRGLTGGSYNGASNVTSTLDTSQNYTWLKVQTFLKNSLGQTTVEGYILKNSTAATSSVQQYSPGLTFMGNAWNTTSSTSLPLNYRLYVSTSSGSFMSNGALTIAVSQNGSTYGNVYSFNPYGDIVTPGYYSSFAGQSTSADGTLLEAGATATSGTTAILSGRLRFNANAWNTSTSAAQTTDFIIENHPISGATPVTSKLVISSQINNGGYTERFALLNNGLFYLNGTAMTANQLAGVNSGATGMEAKTLSGSSATGAVVTNGTGTITFSNDTTVVQTIANFFPKGDTRYASQSGTQTLTNKTISGSSNTITNIGNSSLSNSTISGIALGGNLNALSQGTGISSFSYNGSSTGSVAVDQTFSPTWTGNHTFNNSVTASSGTAQGIAITPSLTAAANNDVLAALDVTPTYSAATHTGVHNTILRGNYSSLGANTTDALILRNTTAATSSVEQYSPALTFMANAWNTASSVSEPLTYRMYVATASGSFLSNGALVIGVSQNGGGYVPDYQFDPYGDLVIAGSYSTFNGGPTSNPGVVVGTGQTATSGTPSILSGRIQLDGNAWNTSTSTAQPTDFIIENHPISGSTITSKLAISSQVNSGGYTERFALLNTGLFYLNGTAMTGNQIVGANSGATGMEAKTLSGSSATGAVVSNGTGTITFSNDTTALETTANFFPKGDTRYLKTTTAAATYQPLLGYTAANNANVVHLTGNESIAGIKTFSSAVGIGTGTVPTGYVFAINGNSIATSITIKAEANWPDYVFTDQYKLQPLSQVANYIAANHHLPDMPSAEEVAKNGQDLGEMNANLVKKVEELTLYLIDKDKQLEEQKKIIAGQQARLEKIEKVLKIDAGN
jgi:Lower baseplate protein N-terminal domain